jgi:hypothetical protein
MNKGSDMKNEEVMNNEENTNNEATSILLPRRRFLFQAGGMLSAIAALNLT